MNPNDYLAGVNACIAAAMLCLAIAFFAAIIQQNRVRGHVQRVFTAGMALGYLFLTFDYGTTATLRFLDIWAFSAIPHSFLPEFEVFPAGITMLMVWRTMLAVILWAVVIYTILVKRGGEANDV